jgi:cytochrome c peroxidase
MFGRTILLSLPIGASILATALAGFVLGKEPSSSAEFDVPLGLPPLTEAQRPNKKLVPLGRKLFFDRRLSFNNTNSCGMCHIEAQGFASNQSALAVGMEGKSLRRNAPSLYNVAYQKLLFHDGREPYLADQVWSPLLSPIEMANPSVGYLVDRVRSLKDYDGLFEQAFGGQGPSMQAIGDAIAAFEKTLLSGNSRFDRWYYGGKTDEFTKEEKEGFELFSGKAGCSGCHTIEKTSALFTDQKFHVTGVGFRAANMPPPYAWQVQLAPGVTTTVKNSDLDSVSEPRMNDIGRFEITLNSADRWAYKTPSLRNVALTYPYMHNGSIGTLEDVVEFYDKGGYPHDGINELKPLYLTPEKKNSLVAFLKSLTGDNRKYDAGASLFGSAVPAD